MNNELVLSFNFRNSKLLVSCSIFITTLLNLMTLIAKLCFVCALIKKALFGRVPTKNNKIQTKNILADSLKYCQQKELKLL